VSNQFIASDRNEQFSERRGEAKRDIFHKRISNKFLHAADKLNGAVKPLANPLLSSAAKVIKRRLSNDEGDWLETDEVLGRVTKGIKHVISQDAADDDDDEEILFGESLDNKLSTQVKSTTTTLHNKTTKGLDKLSDVLNDNVMAAPEQATKLLDFLKTNEVGELLKQVRRRASELFEHPQGGGWDLSNTP